MTRRSTMAPAGRRSRIIGAGQDRAWRGARRALIAGLAAAALGACSPTVRLEAPTEPIEINLNVRIEQEVRIKIDRELDQLFKQEDDIF